MENANRAINAPVLREDDENLRNMFENIPIGMFQSTEEGKFIYVNQAIPAMLGYSSPEELIETVNKRSIADVLYADPTIRPRLLHEVFNTQGRKWNVYEMRYRRKDGSLFDALLTFYQHSDTVTGKTYLYGFVQDVSETKRIEADAQRLQEQLNQAQKMESIGRLAGGVAHDFNNMLGVIFAHTDLLLEEGAFSQNIHESLIEIRNAAERSAELTTQLLSFARKQTVAPKVVNLNEIIDSTTNMLRRIIGEDINLEWRPEKDLWGVSVDVGQVNQILLNLCINARDAINGAGRIIIETANVVFNETDMDSYGEILAGDYVRLSVSDNGCGMDADMLVHIFEPFFTTKEAGKGTGLGLSTVYGVVKQNDGFLRVGSEPGDGTTFNIWFPRNSTDANKLADVKTDKPVEHVHETILLVEDDLSILRVMKRMLEMRGYTVLDAHTPKEALALARKYNGEIHLLLTDVVMPEMNGRDLAQRMMTLYPDLLRLYMSGHTADVIAHHGILHEGVNFIQKPFTMHDLYAKVREVIDAGRG